MGILKNIWKFITGAAAKIKQALSSGKDIANQVKAVADSKVLDAVVNVTSTNLDNVALDLLRKGLAAFVIAMGWADKIISDFEKDPDARAAVLTVINAKASVIIADIKGAKLSIQEALASAPVVYDPKLVE